MQHNGRQLLDLRELLREMTAFSAGFGKDVTDLNKVFSAVGNGVHQALNLADSFGMPLFETITLATEFFGPLSEVCAIFFDIDFNELLVEHVVLRSIQHPGLKTIGRDDAVVGTTELYSEMTAIVAEQPKA